MKILEVNTGSPVTDFKPATTLPRRLLIITECPAKHCIGQLAFITQTNDEGALLICLTESLVGKDNAFPQWKVDQSGSVAASNLRVRYATQQESVTLGGG